jgi:putative chitinase
MSVKIALNQVLKLAPSARTSYKAAFDSGQAVFDQFHISKNNLRVAHFMAQVLHECGGLTIQFENMNYSAKRLPMVWSTRFKPKGKLNPEDYAHNAEKLANSVYGGRMGNTSVGDGYRYRGRGLLQTTGKEGYETATSVLSKYYPNTPIFADVPDEVLSAEWCLKVAAAEWFKSGCNDQADADSVTTVTQLINNGQTGIAERKDWLTRTKNIWRD